MLLAPSVFPASPAPTAPQAVSRLPQLAVALSAPMAPLPMASLAPPAPQEATVLVASPLFAPLDTSPVQVKPSAPSALAVPSLTLLVALPAAFCAATESSPAMAPSARRALRARFPRPELVDALSADPAPALAATFALLALLGSSPRETAPARSALLDLTPLWLAPTTACSAAVDRSLSPRSLVQPDARRALSATTTLPLVALARTALKRRCPALVPACATPVVLVPSPTAASLLAFLALQVSSLLETALARSAQLERTPTPAPPSASRAPAVMRHPALPAVTAPFALLENSPTVVPARAALQTLFLRAQAAALARLVALAPSPTLPRLCVWPAPLALSPTAMASARPARSALILF